METKYLWDRVDALRDALKDIKEENDDLIAENKHLKLRVEELDGFSDDVDVERSRAEVENDELNAELVNTYDKNEDLRIDLKQAIKLRDKFGQERDDNRKNVDILKSEVKRLKAENDSLKVKLNNGENCDHEWYNDLKDVIKSLEEENDSLKDEAVKWNRKYNQVEYPKDYQKEAKEHFHHNPNCKGVRFHMIDFDDYEYDENDGLNGLSGEYNGSLMAEDCLLEIDNEGSKPTFH